MELLTSPDYKFRDFVAIVKNGYAQNESIMQELSKIDLSQVIANIQKPYVIIQGDTDIVTSTKAVKDFVQTLENKNLSCITVKNAGHLPSENAMNSIFEKLIFLSLP